MSTNNNTDLGTTGDDDRAYRDNRPFVSIGDIDLKYEQPNISVSTSARFATHEVIGNVTVRQKLGEDPDELSVEGVCTHEEANQIDQLKDEELVEVVSNRWNGQAQVASTNTRPIAEGGGRDNDQEWLHRFTVELVGIREDTFDFDFDFGEFLI